MLVHAGSWRLEAAGWKLEEPRPGDWRLEAGGIGRWRLGAGGWRLESWKLEAGGSRRFEAAWKLEESLLEARDWSTPRAAQGQKTININKCDLYSAVSNSRI